MSVNEKIIIEMGGQIISIEFGFSFPTRYHNVIYANGKVPPKIMLLYGGISLYRGYDCATVQGGGGICQRLPAFEKIYIKNYFFSKKKFMAVILGKKSCLTLMENPKWAI